MKRTYLLTMFLLVLLFVFCIGLNLSTEAVTLKDRKASGSSVAETPGISVPKPSNVFVTNDDTSPIPVKTTQQNIATQVIWEGKVSATSWPIISVAEFSSVRIVVRRMTSDGATFNVDEQLSSSSRFSDPWCPIDEVPYPQSFYSAVYDIPGEYLRFTTAKGDCWVKLLGRK
jgi:hypothetical protein